MSKNEIIKVLPKLTPKERREIRAKLDELEDPADEGPEDDDLTEEQWKMIDERIAKHEKNPKSSIPWPEAYAALKAHFKI